MLNITVQWSGEYPNKCSGVWNITVEGKEFNIPSAFINKAMETANTYQTWHFDDNMLEVFDSYQDGLKFDEWIKKNIGWIKQSFTKLGLIEKVTIQDLKNLYDLISAEDWRHNSCGGCI